MKKFILLFILSQIGFSQIEGGHYISKYIEHHVLEGDSYKPDPSNSAGWLDCEFFFDPKQQYFEYACGDDDAVKIWYEYEGKEKIGGVMCDVYWDQDGDKLVIDYDNNEIGYFYNLNSANYYKNLQVWSKIEKD